MGKLLIGFVIVVLHWYSSHGMSFLKYVVNILLKRPDPHVLTTLAAPTQSPHIPKPNPVPNPTIKLIYPKGFRISVPGKLFIYRLS